MNIPKKFTASALETREIKAVKQLISQARLAISEGRSSDANRLLLSACDTTSFDTTLIYGLALSRREKVDQHLLLCSFIRKHSSEIDEEMAVLTDEGRGESIPPEQYRNRHFIYWDTGFDEAPELVQICVSAWRKRVGGDLIELNNGNLSNHVEIPEYLIPLRSAAKAHFADYIRILLLYRYGGYWVDATTYPGKNYLAQSAELTRDAFFFAPRRDERTLANSYLYSRPGSYVSRLMLSALSVYIKNYEAHTAYFSFHYLFGVFTMIDQNFRGEFESAPGFSARDYQSLWRRRSLDISTVPIVRILRNHPLQKLSYKFDRAELAENSVLATLLRNREL